MSAKKKMTHFGNELGCDARTPKNYKQQILLRETKLYWISTNGIKYSKRNRGNRAGMPWPMYRIDLDSIKEI